jgi:3-deoxy-D-manno-octulosonic-acid transferase
MLNRFIWNNLYPSICSLILSSFKLLPSKSKLRQWINYRKIEPIVHETYSPSKKTILFVCASLGEFETVKSIISQLRPEFNIHMSFFSPSGYNRLINQSEHYDILSYTPTEKNASLNTFLSVNTIDGVIISGNDLWPNFLGHLINKGIPYIYVGMTLRSKSIIHSWFIKENRHLLMGSRHIFSHSEETIGYLSELGVNSKTYTAHPRLHSILQDSKSIVLDPIIVNFAQNHKILVMGSTHPKDEALFINIHKKLSKEIKTIIVPHDIDSEHIQRLQRKLHSAKIWSESTDLSDCQILIIDTMGMLKDLYSIADVTYIGGGFDKGIHNILEAAIHYHPILFGPNYHKFTEAQQLINSGLAHCIKEHVYFLNLIKNCLSQSTDPTQVRKYLNLDKAESDLGNMLNTISKCFPEKV